jgi:hypothetical protein
MKNLNVVHIKYKNLSLILDQLTKTLKNMLPSTIIQQKDENI